MRVCDILNAVERCSGGDSANDQKSGRRGGKGRQLATSKLDEMVANYFLCNL